MKVFRRSFWKTKLIGDLRLSLIILVVLVFPVFYSMGFLLKWYLFFGLSLGLLFFPFFLFSFFYVTLSEDRLIIRNGVCPFWRKEYLYEDIIKVDIVWPGYMAKHYLQVFTNRKRSWRYFIEDLVDSKDYQEIVDMIRAKKILVETKGLDQWVR